MLTRFRLRLHVPSRSLFSVSFEKWVQHNPMVLFTHDVKKIRDAAHKNSDVDGMCKRAFKRMFTGT